MKDDRPTSLDIAHLAGVSQSTVSRALSGSHSVNLETRKKIEAIAKELNYQVDRRASNLRTKHTNTIALLLCADPGWGDSQINPFFLSILGSIARATATRGYDLLVSFQQLSDDWATEFESAHRADGIILLGYGDYVDYGVKLAKLKASGAHFVTWGPLVPGEPEYCLIGCDNTGGGWQLTKHLLGLGHKRIAFLGDISDRNPEFAQRYAGYAKAVRQHDLEVDPALQVNVFPSSEEAGYYATQQLIKDDIEFDALFGASDLIAMGAMQALDESGRSIPGDVAVVGFDGIPITVHTHPPLTTIRQDTLSAGELLVDNLLKIIRGEEGESALIPIELVIRKSCGAS